jgi:hypothetical protein
MTLVSLLTKFQKGPMLRSDDRSLCPSRRVSLRTLCAPPARRGTVAAFGGLARNEEAPVYDRDDLLRRISRALVRQERIFVYVQQKSSRWHRG